MSDKRKWPRAEALAVANELVAHLADIVERIEIAGSLRRCKAEVGDIELLFIPRYREAAEDLFATKQVDLADDKIDQLFESDVILKRPSKIGAFTWGPKNKLAIHVASGISVDFFATDRACWFNALVCRTGGKDSNLLITTTAQRQGWSFEAYGRGFRKLDSAEHHQTTSERDVFEFIGLPYLEPKDRP